jgi:hypothetical protein
MRRTRRVELALLATTFLVFEFPGCLTTDEVSTQFSNSVTDFFAALFRTGLGNLLEGVF